MSNNNKIGSLKSVFAAAIMLGAGAITADAQVYSMSGSGGGGRGDYSALELPYPNGEARRVLYPYSYYDNDVYSSEEKQALQDRMVPILRDYVANVMPQMPSIYEEDFAFVITNLSDMLGTDEMTLCKEVGYNCQFIVDSKADIDINRFAYLDHQLNTAYRGAGYHIRPAAMVLDENDINDINELLDRLRPNYPNDQRYQIPDYTNDHLVKIRKELAEKLANSILIFGSDLVSGSIDPKRVDNKVQDYLSRISRVLSEPEAIKMRYNSEAAKYNSKMPEYIDEILRTKYGLTEADRNRLYAMIFKTRDNYDYRSLPREDDFIAERDVIDAPKP